MASKINRKYGGKIGLVLAVLLIIMFLVSFSSAIPREDLRKFLRQEIRNYFYDEPTLLTKGELRKAILLYFFNRENEVNLNMSSLSKESIQIIEGAIELSTGIENDFSCSLSILGGGGINKSGYTIACKKNSMINPFFCFWYGVKCYGKDDVKLTECLDYVSEDYIESITEEDVGKYFSKKVGEICKEELGDKYTAPAYLWNKKKETKLKNFKECTYREYPGNRIVEFSLSKGATKNLGNVSGFYPEYGEAINSREINISCDSGILGRITNRVIYVERS